MKIEPGIIVWLKSGGLPMTVKKKHPNSIKGDEWLCSWFDGADQKEWTFIENQLTSENPNIPEESRAPIGYNTSNL